MRQIKFRAWDTKEKKWLFGYETLGGFSMFGELHIMDELHGLEKLNDVKVMQFTGLLDKNGKEIYEGDILANEMEVVCGNQFGQITVRRRFLERGKEKEVLFHEVRKAEEIEIIGNIWENPELPTPLNN